MPLTVGEGSISLAVDHLMVMLADSATFRTWVGAANQPAALARIYYEALPPPANRNEYTLAEAVALRPFAQIWSAPHAGFTKRPDAAGAKSAESGSLSIQFEQTVDSSITTDAAEISRRLANTIGKIMDEMDAVREVAGYLCFTAMTFSGLGRGRMDERSGQGDFVVATLEVEWGQR